LKELEKENTRLKGIVADQALDIDISKELNRDAPMDQVGSASAEKSARGA